MRLIRWTVVAVGVFVLAGCNAQGIEQTPSSGVSSAASSPSVAPSSTAETERVTVTGTEFAFAPAEIEASAGTSLAVTFVNQGKLEHDWTVFDADGVPVMGLHALAPPGEEATVLLDLEPGRYQVWCTIPGHREAGMTGSITVK